MELKLKQSGFYNLKNGIAYKKYLRKCETKGGKLMSLRLKRDFLVNLREMCFESVNKRHLY